MQTQPLNLPEEKQALLEQAASSLSAIPGMAAVVLGGSYAAGTAHAASDLDIGLYYFDASPFSIAEIRRVAGNLALQGLATVTGFYEWGAWVNGGAWIHTPHGKVDFLYRSLDQLHRTIDEAQQGIVHHDYDQQPSYGFYSVIYLAETQICIPFFDPQGLVSELKRLVARYPARLKESLVADNLWGAEFTLVHAQGFAAQGDIYNTAGCLGRTAANLTQALFALNERYFQRDKQVMETLAAFPILPQGYVQKLTRILAHPGSSTAELAQAVGDMRQLWRSVAELTGGQYQPKFLLS
jgi:hypothetical protein